MQNISADITPNTQPSTQGGNVHWVRNERMAGTVPSYGRDAHATNLSHISNFNNQDHGHAQQIGSPQEEFTFKDLIDMVNPFHHIPIVNMIYRDVTGDQIKPASKVMGGAVFGGPVGAASSLVNIIIEQETGDDLAGNALSAIGVKEKAQRQDKLIAQKQAYQDLPVALLAFAEMPLSVAENKEELRPNEKFEMVHVAEGRTAGSIPRYYA